MRVPVNQSSFPCDRPICGRREWHLPVARQQAPRRWQGLVTSASLAFGALVLAACQVDEPSVGQEDAGQATLGVTPGDFRYDVEYPSMGYSENPAANRVARLQTELEAGTVALEYSERGGYLVALLGALDIDVSSQMLVFSKTSLQTEGIHPETPRAIFFNDDTYVAFVQGAGSLEIAAMDAKLGPVFYTRRLGLCLRCHDSYSLTGGGVPRFITGSGYIGTDGSLISHEGWILTSYKTSIRNRWGGWYVSGFHGEQVHLGNIAAENAAALQRLDELRNGNYESVVGLVDTGPYLTEFSDVVALLVLEHQTQLHNVITRVDYDLRTGLDGSGLESGDDDGLAAITEPLVEALLFVGEAELTDRIRGTSGFAQHFESKGPQDSRGRSLRQFNLETRLFDYPLSYVIYSEAFDALPDPARSYVYRRISELLRDPVAGSKLAELELADREAILQILAETKPEFAAEDALRD